MKRIAQVLFAIVVATTLAGAASASPATPRIDQRRAIQHARIREGVRSGRLTPREARRLRRDERHIGRMERRIKADGVVTGRERWRMNRALNRESRRIGRFEHNRRFERRHAFRHEGRSI